MAVTMQESREGQSCRDNSRWVLLHVTFDVLVCCCMCPTHDTWCIKQVAQQQMPSRADPVSILLLTNQSIRSTIVNQQQVVSGIGQHSHRPEPSTSFKLSRFAGGPSTEQADSTQQALVAAAQEGALSVPGAWVVTVHFVASAAQRKLVVQWTAVVRTAQMSHNVRTNQSYK